MKHGRSRLWSLAAVSWVVMLAACQLAPFVPPTVTPTSAQNGNAAPRVALPWTTPPEESAATPAQLVASPTPLPSRTPAPTPRPTEKPLLSLQIGSGTGAACVLGQAGGSFKDVVVRAGNRCDITGGIVEGNIQVEAGGELYLKETIVGGNIAGQGVYRVLVDGSAVAGNIVIHEATGFAAIQGSAVKGSVQLGQNAVAVLRENRVGGSVTVLSNRHLEMYDNEVTGSMTCDGNRSAGGEGCRS